MSNSSYVLVNGKFAPNKPATNSVFKTASTYVPQRAVIRPSGQQLDVVLPKQVRSVVKPPAPAPAPAPAPSPAINTADVVAAVIARLAAAGNTAPSVADVTAAIAATTSR